MLAWTLRAACRGHAPVWRKQVPEHLGSASMESEGRANGENRHQKWLRGKKSIELTKEKGEAQISKSGTRRALPGTSQEQRAS